MYKGILALSIAVASAGALGIRKSNSHLRSLGARESLVSAVNIIKVGLAVVSDLVAYRVIQGLGCQDSVLACSLIGFTYTMCMNCTFGNTINIRAYRIASKERMDKIDKLIKEVDEISRKAGLDKNGK